MFNRLFFTPIIALNFLFLSLHCNLHELGDPLGLYFLTFDNVAQDNMPMREILAYIYHRIPQANEHQRQLKDRLALQFKKKFDTDLVPTQAQFVHDIEQKPSVEVMEGFVVYMTAYANRLIEHADCLKQADPVKVRDLITKTYTLLASSRQSYIKGDTELNNSVIAQGADRSLALLSNTFSEHTMLPALAGTGQEPLGLAQLFDLWLALTERARAGVCHDPGYWPGVIAIGVKIAAAYGVVELIFSVYRFIQIRSIRAKMLRRLPLPIS